MRQHPLNKLYESGAEPVNGQACKGMTRRAGPSNQFEDQQREAARQAARSQKKWAQNHRDFRLEIYRLLRYFRIDLSLPRLPYGIRDSQTVEVLVAPDCVPVWSESEMFDLSDKLRQAFGRYPASDRFPFAFIDSETGIDLVSTGAISFDTAIRVLRIRASSRAWFSAGGYRSLLEQFFWEVGGIRIPGSNEIA